MNKVIVVAVHPDDETLACGGTLLKHRSNGDEIYWLIVTAMAEENGYEKKKVAQREDEIAEVAAEFRFKRVIRFDFPTFRLDEVPVNRLISEFSAVFRDIEPNIVYLPFKGDVHSDHRVAFNAAYSCTKSFRFPFIERILMMETISETDFAPALSENAFLPNYYVDITGFLDTKKKIFQIFESEIGKHPFPRSLKNIEAVAILRGAQCNAEHAEAFMVLKEIER
jgi:LmbE family N-acetylglucosaminyl deacetylase